MCDVMIYENLEITTFKKKRIAEDLILNYFLRPQHIKTVKCIHIKCLAPL